MSSAGLAVVRVRNEPMVPPDHMNPELSLYENESIWIYLALSESMIPMRVLESDSIESVKLRIQTYKGFVVKNQKLVCGGRELARSNSLIRDYGVNDGNVLHLIHRLSNLQVINVKTPDRDFSLEPVIVNPKVELPSVIVDMIKSTFDGLDSGKIPIRSVEGTGGAYFMQDSSGQKFVAVFKPIDEEPLAVNNPRKLPVSPDGEGLKKGTRVGEGAVREVAAFILDHPKNERRARHGDEKGFAGVPPTAMIKCLHSGFNNPDDLATVKIGSLQMFVENSESCEDMGPGSFPVEQVHKISVLDIRLANADRHAGNILLSKDEDGQTLLVPIDHGYCLPESFEDCTFDWLYWPQSRQSFSPETIDYIKSLDAEEDIALLKFLGWDMPPKCARTLCISTMLLKKGAERGLTPFDIGSIMCRENLMEESVIEEIVKETQDSVLPGTSEAAFLETLSQIMDLHLDEIARSRL